nr:RhuM family protein [Parazoarcus communis]
MSASRPVVRSSPISISKSNCSVSARSASPSASFTRRSPTSTPRPFYDVTAKATKRFFATVQNKLHWAIHGQTAAEVVYHRADADQPNMGLTTWKDAPLGKIQKFDVVVAKNYLTEPEMAQLSRLVNAYLDVAEDMAQRKIPMTMQDWETRLNRFIEATDREVLQDAGKVTAEIAKAHAESEFEKYRIVQDRLFESDFDRLLKQIEAGNASDSGKE